MKLRLTRRARRDLAQVMEWTVKEFGERAPLRYDALIKLAFKDILENPERPGSRARTELAQGTRIYHLASSRSKMRIPRVQEPRHFLLYRVRDEVIEVARILHDARDLEGNLPREYRR